MSQNSLILISSDEEESILPKEENVLSINNVRSLNAPCANPESSSRKRKRSKSSVIPNIGLPHNDIKSISSTSTKVNPFFSPTKRSCRPSISPGTKEIKKQKRSTKSPTCKKQCLPIVIDLEDSPPEKVVTDLPLINDQTKVHEEESIENKSSSNIQNNSSSTDNKTDVNMVFNKQSLSKNVEKCKKVYVRLERITVPKSDNENMKELFEAYTFERNSKLFQTFTDRCCQLEADHKDRSKIRDKLTKSLDRTDKDYIVTEEFATLIDKYQLNLKRGNLYFCMKEVLDNLKIHRPIKRPVLQAVPSTSKDSAVFVVAENGDKPTVPGEQCGDDLPPETLRIIEKLEKTLEKIKRKISRLELAETNLDDEDNSAYLRLTRYEDRFNKVYLKLCEYTGGPKYAGRRAKTKVRFNATKYPELNSVIQQWLNKTGIFPDYADVYKLLSTHKELWQLGAAQESIDALANRTFNAIGEILQKRRKLDLNDLMSTYCQNDNDPAMDDPELLARLEENRRFSRKKVDDLIDEYAEKELTQKLQPEPVPDDAPVSPKGSETEEDHGEEETDDNSIVCSSDDSSDEKGTITTSSADDNSRHVAPTSNDEDVPEVIQDVALVDSHQMLGELGTITTSSADDNSRHNVPTSKDVDVPEVIHQDVALVDIHKMHGELGNFSSSIFRSKLERHCFSSSSRTKLQKTNKENGNCVDVPNRKRDENYSASDCEVVEVKPTEKRPIVVHLNRVSVRYNFDKMPIKTIKGLRSVLSDRLNTMEELKASKNKERGKILEESYHCPNDKVATFPNGKISFKSHGTIVNGDTSDSQNSSSTKKGADASDNLPEAEDDGNVDSAQNGNGGSGGDDSGGEEKKRNGGEIDPDDDEEEQEGDDLELENEGNDCGQDDIEGEKDVADEGEMADAVGPQDEGDVDEQEMVDDCEPEDEGDADEHEMVDDGVPEDEGDADEQEMVDDCEPEDEGDADEQEMVDDCEAEDEGDADEHEMVDDCEPEDAEMEAGEDGQETSQHEKDRLDDVVPDSENVDEEGSRNSDNEQDELVINQDVEPEPGDNEEFEDGSQCAEKEAQSEEDELQKRHKEQSENEKDYERAGSDGDDNQIEDNSNHTSQGHPESEHPQALEESSNNDDEKGNDDSAEKEKESVHSEKENVSDDDLSLSERLLQWTKPSLIEGSKEKSDDDNDDTSTISDKDERSPLNESNDKEEKGDVEDETEILIDDAPTIINVESKTEPTMSVDVYRKRPAVPPRMPAPRYEPYNPSRKRRVPSDIEVVSQTVSPTINNRSPTNIDMSADERVKRFLQSAGTSLSITVKRKKPMSEETKQALEQLKKLKNISATRVPRNQPDVMVIEDGGGGNAPGPSRLTPPSRPTPRPSPRPFAATPMRVPQRTHLGGLFPRTPSPRGAATPMYAYPRFRSSPRPNGLPMISSVQSCNNTRTPVILAVRGSAPRARAVPSTRARGMQAPVRGSPTRGRGAPTRGGTRHVPYVVLD